MFDKILFKKIDNSALIIFRIIFGFLIALEGIGAVFTGWVRRAMIAPEFTFNFIGLDFLQPLPGYGMYVYYIVMGIFGIGVMLGYRYRLSMIAYTIMWAGVYFMQKASYNNHYYLMVLLCAIMSFMPAHKDYSLDVKQGRTDKSSWMYSWYWWLIVLQQLIVYTYASVAKWYPDWISARVAKNLMASKEHFWLIGDFLQKVWVHQTIAGFGLFFDALIVPFLLIKKTRKYAFFAGVFFHLFNSAIFHIGIFPYMSIGLFVFFFEPKIIKNIFLKKKDFYAGDEVSVQRYKRPLLIIGITYLLIQIALPLRHWAIEEPVLWSEEGHRLSWRMMLRSKYGYIKFRVKDKATGKIEIIDPKDRLTRKQNRIVATKPDVIWQFAQRLKKEYQANGQEVAIYARGRVSINGGDFHQLIDPKVDLAAVKWNPWKHSDWILPAPEDFTKKTARKKSKKTSNKKIKKNEHSE